VTTNAAFDFLNKYQPKEWNDVHLLQIYLNGCESFGVQTTKKPILSLEDWKGKSIRAQGVNGLMVTALGAAIRDLSLADTFDALSKGVVDGIVSSPETLLGWKFADVCKYVSLTIGLGQATPIFYNAMNKDKWNSLPPDIQKVINETSQEYQSKLVMAFDSAQIEGLQYAKKAGVSIAAVPQDEIKRWMTAITPVIDNYLKSLTTKGYTQQEVNEAWKYFQERVDYWNGQLSQNKINPLMSQAKDFFK
jgi:TRAP-type transport system periplasmic protein